MPSFLNLFYQLFPFLRYRNRERTQISIYHKILFACVLIFIETKGHLLEEYRESLEAISLKSGAKCHSENKILPKYKFSATVNIIAIQKQTSKQKNSKDSNDVLHSELHSMRAQANVHKFYLCSCFIYIVWEFCSPRNILRDMCYQSTCHTS